MTDVRIDQHSLPKAPVYDLTTPLAHRNSVTAVDSGDPAESAGIDTAGYEECRFDLGIGGVGFVHLELQAIFGNSRQSLWFGGGRRTFTSTGRHALVVPCRDQKLFLKATSFNGTSFSLDADYALSWACLP